MSCPSCGYTLQKLSVTTDSGGKFDVDHCGRCGGTWFDPYEINRIPYHEVVRLAKMTVLTLNSPALLDKNLCPRCHKELVQLSSESLPAKTRLLRCLKCHGIWATQKVLTDFKTHQKETINEYKNKGIAYPSLSIIFVPALFTALLFFSTFLTVTKLQEARENRTKAASMNEYSIITPISPTSASIVFRTNSKVKSSISYGLSSLEMKTVPISIIPSLNHSLIIEDLKPDNLYIYTITFADQTGLRFTTDEQSFSLAR